MKMSGEFTDDEKEKGADGFNSELGFDDVCSLHVTLVTVPRHDLATTTTPNLPPYCPPVVQPSAPPLTLCKLPSNYLPDDLLTSIVNVRNVKSLWLFFSCLRSQGECEPASSCHENPTVLRLDHRRWW